MACSNNNLGCVLSIAGTAFATFSLCFVICAFAKYGANYVYSTRYIYEPSHYSVIISAFAMHIIAAIAVTAAMVSWVVVLFRGAFLERKLFNKVNVVVNFVAFILLLIAATLMTAATLRLEWTLYPKYRDYPQMFDYEKPPYNDNPWWSVIQFDSLLFQNSEIAEVVKILGQTLNNIFYYVLNKEIQSRSHIQTQYDVYNSLFTLQILADFMQAKNSNLNVKVYEITNTYLILLWIAFVFICVSFALAITVCLCVARNDQPCCYSDEETVVAEKEQQNVLEKDKTDVEQSVKSEDIIADTNQVDDNQGHDDNDYADEVSMPTPTPTTPQMEDKLENQLVPEEELPSPPDGKEASTHPSLVAVPLEEEPSGLGQKPEQEGKQDANNSKAISEKNNELVSA